MSQRVRGTLTSAHIKTLLARIGSGVGGTKPELTQRLHSDLDVPKLQNETKTSRILSVDMGIRNMAFCVCDVSVKHGGKKPSAKPSVKLDVLAWEPISVSDLALQEEASSSSDPANLLSSQISQQGKESFRPSILSRTAYALLKRKFLPYAPQTILIEQQRYRTNASSAIQEWTYHVNMLEGMIWAILETLKQESSGRLPTTAAKAQRFPSVFPVSPARVAAFWMDNSELGRAIRDESLGGATRRASSRSRSAAAEAEEDAGSGEEDEAGSGARPAKKMSKTKVEKKVKIKLVEQWLLQNAGDAAATSGSDRDVQLSFGTPEAGGMRDTFLAKLSKPAKGGGRKKKATATTAALAEAPAPAQAAGHSPPADPKKLDDLADCLLQAAAWAQWESNRRAMLGLDEGALKEVAERSS
ncbi:putative dna-binding sap protein [Neofusicoccum parvum UCRNP2]|uniref:Putative dna-binding sap protein n=1 Tax=Botryosphaeria parva (strain UCR-NP2) TaxID=1287680 RepID=R1ET77_BOTPV|nr:putative dna-binding sap protein [Neofusicoccum parvum UCRNP2]